MTKKPIIICDDEEPDFMFEDMRPSQPGLIDLTGQPDLFSDAIREAENAVKH
jgi:hypothetical protein